MNERIRELMIQAMSETGRLMDVQATYQRFAELIVRECAKVCDDVASDSHGDWRGGAWECETGIKEHFGVK